MSEYRPRIKCDQYFVQDLLAARMLSKARTASSIAAEPGFLTQTRHSGLASDCSCIALYRYALGYPLDIVRPEFRDAAQATLVVFHHRGTEPRFPVTVVTIDPGIDPQDPTAVEYRQRHPPDSMDFSSTNSKKGLQGVFYALIAADLELARKVADLLWDPPGASYMGPKSETCTANDQHFAYAVKHLLRRSDELAKSEMAKIRLTKHETWIPGARKMVEGIATRDTPLFVNGLDDELARHQLAGEKKRNAWRPERYLSVTGLGMAALALQLGVASLGDLPDDVYLPKELLNNGAANGPV